MLRLSNRKQRRSQARMRAFYEGKRVQAEQAAELAASSVQHDKEGRVAAASVGAVGAAPLAACEPVLEPAALANPMTSERRSGFSRLPREVPRAWKTGQTPQAREVPGLASATLPMRIVLLGLSSCRDKSCYQV